MSIENQVIVGEAVAGEAAETKKALEKLIYTINRSTFDVAELLSTVKHKGYYKGYGFDTFLEYVSELDLKTRKAQYLVRIVDVMDEVGVSRDEYEPVGIAKLREITSLDVKNSEGEPNVFDDPDTGVSHSFSDIIVGLIQKAPEMSLEDIKKYVRTVKGFFGDNDTAWVNICVNRQALEQTITPALELAKKNLGTAKKDNEGLAQDYGDGKALEIISVEYLQDPANQFLGGEMGQ